MGNSDSDEGDGDFALVRAAQGGDLDAFSLLVERHHRAVLAYLGTRLNTPADAEDLAQDVFVTAFEKIGDFRPDSPFSPWLRGIAHNHLRNFLRKFRPSYLGGSEELDFLVSEEIVQRAAGSEPAIFAHLEDCVRELAHGSRRILQRRYMIGESIDEIAADLGRSYSAISMQLHRTRAALAHCIKGKRLPNAP